MNEREWRERGLRDAVRAGDERAWRVLYDESYAGLDAFVAWRCGGLRDLADDVLQETWLTAVRRVAEFDPTRAAFATWLRGIAANVLRNAIRRQKIRQTAPLGSPESRSHDTALRVAEALAELPENYEQVLRAKYLDGHSVDEIAAMRGESFKSVESLLTRARVAFRSAFGGDGESQATNEKTTS